MRGNTTIEVPLEVIHVTNGAKVGMKLAKRREYLVGDTAGMVFLGRSTSCWELLIIATWKRKAAGRIIGCM
jgi:hypothetical protein